MKPPEIEIGSDVMLNAFKVGLAHYQPTAGGHKLGCEEAGVTDFSVANLHDLFQMVPERPNRIEAGPEGVLICWPVLETYYATGFGFGYAGEGSEGLVHFAVEHGFGDEDSVRQRVREVGMDFRGVLFEKKGGSNLEPEGRTP